MKTWIAEIVDEELFSQLYLNETDTAFIERVCGICLTEIESAKGYTPAGFGADVISEIERQVVEVFRIRTYGHFNLQAYRKNQLKKRVA